MKFQKLILLSSWIFVGCNQGFQAQPLTEVGFSQKSDESSPSWSSPSSPSLIGICGPLNFNGVTWPVTISGLNQAAFALGLGVTGSFEGHAGWSNITNNFDGQGFSLGLLQQNLGQGSLQPLLVQFEKSKVDSLANYFQWPDVSSLKSMLSQWSVQNGGSVLGKTSVQAPQDELFPDQETLSPLDEDFGLSSEGFESKIETLATQTQSVQWATGNLYEADGKTFKTRWKTGFTNLANSAVYRSLQIAAAQNIYKKAQSYFKAFGFTEMRMMILMFDFVTQNGGFNSTHKAQFEAYLASHPHDSETTRALKLLEIRVASVKAQYQDDVRARKSTIINGVGKVHGANRTLEKEYCYQGSQKI